VHGNRENSRQAPAASTDEKRVAPFGLADQPIISLWRAQARFRRVCFVLVLLLVLAGK
jgi:hypothetical protein